MSRRGSCAAGEQGHGFPCRGTRMTARGAHGSMDSPPAPLAQPESASLSHLNPRPLGRRLNGGGEGAWIPVSEHGNDGARRAHGSMDSPPAPLAQPESASLPHLNPRPLGRLNGGGEGAWIPVSGHGNDGARRLWLHGLAARATCAARGWVAPPTSILPLWGGGQTAARKGHGFPCRGTGMTARGGGVARSASGGYTGV